MTQVTEATVSELLTQAKAGSSDAQSALLALYCSYLRAIAQRQVSPAFQARFAPSDVVQETLLRAGQGFEGFLGTTEPELSRWLVTILSSQLATQIRRHSRQQRSVRRDRSLQSNGRPSLSPVPLEQILAAAEESPSTCAVRHERAARLDEVLGRLPMEYRHVIVMRHLRGQSFEDIAEEMNRSIDSVRGIWRRAFSRLRQLLDDEDV